MQRRRGVNDDMMTVDIMTYLPVLLRSDPSHVVIRPFIPAETRADNATDKRPRAQRIADRVLALSEGEMRAELGRVTASLTE